VVQTTSEQEKVMANKPGPESGSPIRTRVQPTESGQAQPTFAANVVSIAREAGGFTLVFYSIPADVLDSPPVKAQIDAQRENPPGGVIDVAIQSEPAAKLFIPITTAAGLAQLLSENLRGWFDTYGREMRTFLESGAKATAEGAAKPSA
jgi:hypothetical protein